MTMVTGVQGVLNVHEYFEKIDAKQLANETKIFHEAINASALDLYQTMAQVRNIENKNFMFFTPNLFASLSMLYAGAPPELKTVMEGALHMGGLSKDSWHFHFQRWSEGIEERSQTQLPSEKKTKTIGYHIKQLLSGIEKTKTVGYHFQQVQMIASRVDAPLTTSAEKNLRYYRPELFVFNKPKDAQTYINERVEKVTEGKIKDLVSEDTLNDDLVLIMASAALFKGQWLYPFSKQRNSEEVFYNADGSKVRVEMMNQGLDNLKMAYDSRMEFLEMPFHGNISLLIIKPNSNAEECAGKLQKYMTRENIQALFDNFDERFTKTSGLSIGLPKIDLKDKTDLMEELKNTVLAKAIKDANFTNSLVYCNERVSTPKLVSEINFTMDEEGAQVAAASYSPSYRQSCDPTFKLNGPFGMAIIDRTNQTILGIGQVLKMTGESVTQDW